MNTYLMWAYYAFIQNETLLGKEFLRHAARLNPSILDGSPCELMNFFMTCIIADENLNHETLLRQIITQLPEEMALLSNQYRCVVSRGDLIEGVRAVVWDRSDDGSRHFEKAAELGILFDETLISQLTQYLLDYSLEFGDIALQKKIHEITPHLEKLGGRSSVRQF